jgi:hypothetical protein
LITQASKASRRVETSSESGRGAGLDQNDALTTLKKGRCPRRPVPAKIFAVLLGTVVRAVFLLLICFFFFSEVIFSAKFALSYVVKSGTFRLLRT